MTDAVNAPADISALSFEEALAQLERIVAELESGQAPLEQVDVSKVIARMPPLGTDFVRLPWSVPRPIPDPLRAIVNRATDRQERQRYRNARTFARAIEGWQKAENEAGGGPMALLSDKLRAAGTLPSSPGAAA